MTPARIVKRPCNDVSVGAGQFVFVNLQPSLFGSSCLKPADSIILHIMRLMLVMLLCRFLRDQCVISVSRPGASTARSSNDDDGDGASGDGDRKRRPECDASFLDLDRNTTFDDCDDNLSLFLRHYGCRDRPVPLRRPPLKALRQEDAPDGVARGDDILRGPEISVADTSPPHLLELFYPRFLSKAAGMRPQGPIANSITMDANSVDVVCVDDVKEEVDVEASQSCRTMSGVE